MQIMPITPDFEKSYQAFDIDSLECKIILSGEQTGGRHFLIEIHFLGSEDLEGPLHLHTREKLIVYVMEESLFLNME